VLGKIGIFLTILFGSLICDWICPFGPFQVWLGILGEKIFGKRYNTFIPRRIDSVLRYLRYLVFAMLFYMTIMTEKLAS
jgi:polyferredoxin